MPDKTGKTAVFLRFVAVFTDNLIVFIIFLDYTYESKTIVLDFFGGIYEIEITANLNHFYPAGGCRSRGIGRFAYTGADTSDQRRLFEFGGIDRQILCGDAEPL
ncbi:MAG: hypothetical protein LBI94_04130 [Treponema sp.]|nr:hypothetical protein [Treponema sp.]